MESLVFESYRECGSFVSPFAINNPSGWRYWLLHFANEPKARQVYNDSLHTLSGIQGHCGRLGLRMLAHDPGYEKQYYMFADDDRKRGFEQLMYDIPAALAETGDAMRVSDFYHFAMNETPAHSDDIARAIVENSDLIVKTENGGERRSARELKSTDTIILNPQRSFSFIPSIFKLNE